MRITISGPVLFSRLCRFGVCVVCGTGSFLVPCFDFSPSLYECSGFIFLAPPPDFYTAAAKKRLECVTIHKPWQHEGTSSGCIEKYPFVCMYRCKSFLSGYLNLPECNIVCSVMMMLDCFHLFGLSVCKVFYFTFR